MKRGGWIGWSAAGVGTLLASLGAIGVVLADSSLQLPPVQRQAASDALAERFARRRRAKWRSAELKAADGERLSGWLFAPEYSNGSAVILLHGISGSRRTMLAYAAMLLRHGYVVLVLDSRGHGKSGGRLFTFGVLEKNDIESWVAWLKQETSAKKVFGLGESMGAAILIQAADCFDAIVAECSFTSFRDIACRHIKQKTGLTEWLAAAPVAAGFLAARLRHGVDLWKASPLECIAKTKTPILLIHGGADTRIPPTHSQSLAAANPACAELWLVDGASHTEAISTVPREFRRRVIEWFSSKL